MHDSMISSPQFPVPAGACDCHVHVFLPERFAYDERRKYTPPRAGVDDLLALHGRLQLRRTVLVQPSCYGRDNSAMLFAIESIGQASARGVCVVDPAAVTDGELKALDRAGVRGIRLNAHVEGGGPEQVGRLCRLAAERIEQLGWHLQLHVGAPMLAPLAQELSGLKIPVVLDHFAGGASVADTVGTLLASGKVWLKLSAPYRVSPLAGHADLQAAVKRYLAIAPDRLLWASDWPHTGGDGTRTADPARIEPFRAEDAGAALNRLARWVGDAALLERILVRNPAALYGF